MKGVGSMTATVSTVFVAIACQTCGGFNTSAADELVSLKVKSTASSFADATAPASYNAYDVVPNSFNTPLYGEQSYLTVTTKETFGPATAKIGATHNAVKSLEWSGSEGVRRYKADRKAARLTRPMETERDFAAELAFSAPKAQTGLDFDVGFAPRFTVQDEGSFERRRVGAEVRLGQDFDARGSAPAEGWYVFAGADGEALVWERGDAGLVDFDGMKLRDQITVGDMQAGFAIHRGGGELSLSYIRREIEYSDRNGGFSTNEDFAGVSFTLKH